MTLPAEPKQEGHSAPDHPGSSSHFGLLNAFVDDGHQGRLMGVRAAVWLTYLRHADATACACPSNDTLAKAAGHSQSRHVREARAELVRLGYLVDTARIHPKYKTPIYRLTLPRIGAPCPFSGHGAPIPLDTLPLFRASPCPDSAENPAPNRGTKQLIQQPIQQPIQQSGGGTAAAKPSSATAARPAPAPIPTILDVPEFREAWGEWLQHKRERRETMTEIAQKKQLKRLSQWTDGAGAATRAVAAINHSIAQNWQGIFEERDAGRGSGVGRPAAAQRKTPAQRGEYCRPMPVRVRQL